MTAYPTPFKPLGSGLIGLHDLAILVDAAGQQRHAESAAGVDEGGVIHLGNAQMVGVLADEHALETVEGRLEAQEVRMSPPEAVGLPIERQARVDARVGKQEPALVIHGRASHGHDQGVVTGPDADRTAQADGIVGDLIDRHAGEAGGIFAVRAVAAQRAFQPVFEHPREHDAWGR